MRKYMETKMKRIKNNNVVCMVKKKSENNTQCRTRITRAKNGIITVEKKKQSSDNTNGNESQRHVIKYGILNKSQPV